MGFDWKRATAVLGLDQVRSSTEGSGFESQPVDQYEGNAEELQAWRGILEPDETLTKRPPNRRMRSFANVSRRMNSLMPLAACRGHFAPA